MARPVGTLPVKATLSTRGWADSAAPANVGHEGVLRGSSEGPKRGPEGVMRGCPRGRYAAGEGHLVHEG
eukprot:1216181-Pyramimonas_sp.AAC.1